MLVCINNKGRRVLVCINNSLQKKESINNSSTKEEGVSLY